MRLATVVVLLALAASATSGGPVIQRVNEMIQAAQSAEKTIEATANKEMQQVLTIVEAILKALLGERNYALLRSALQQAVAAIRGAVSPKLASGNMVVSQDAGSWDGYIDNLIAQTKDASGATHADKACIFGLDGGAPWTTDAHAHAWKMSGSERSAIANAMKSKDFTSLMANGIYAGGVKYQFLREEDKKIIYGKKKGKGALTCQASKTAVVCAHTKEGSQQGNVNKGVAVIAEYLESLGMLTTSQDAGSWDSYIDNLIAQTKDASGKAHADKACIFGIDGGAPWTTDGHANAWKMSSSERVAIANAMKSKDFTSLQMNGIHAGGVKYQFLREEDKKVIYGKKKGKGALTCQSSKTAVVCAHTKEGSQQGNVNKGVAVIAEYLESLGMLTTSQDAGSWDGYIDNLIAQTKDASGTPHADKACIFGIDGGAPWTTDGHAMAWKMSHSERLAIANAMKSKDFTSLQMNGIHAGGVKYQFLREEDKKVLYGKKKGKGAITCQSSIHAVVCAHTKEGMQQGNVNKGVAVIAEYLEGMGMLTTSQDAGSWDSYIDNLIAQTKDASGKAHADKACIFGIDGGAPWTTDGHANAWKMSSSERVAIANAMKSKDFTSLQMNGIHAGGVKYQFLREEDKKVILGKKKGKGAITCQSSKTAVVCAHTKEGLQQGNVNKGVAVIAEYLESLGMLAELTGSF